MSTILGELLVKYKADTSDLTTKVTQAKADMSSMSSAVKDASDTMKRCRLTHKFAQKGRYASEEENGEDMCQILIGSLGYILLLNIPESRHHTFTSHLRCQSQHETGRICRLSWLHKPEE